MTKLGKIFTNDTVWKSGKSARSFLPIIPWLLQFATDKALGLGRQLLLTADSSQPANKVQNLEKSRRRLLKIISLDNCCQHDLANNN